MRALSTAVIATHAALVAFGCSAGSEPDTGLGLAGSGPSASGGTATAGAASGGAASGGVSAGGTTNTGGAPKGNTGGTVSSSGGVSSATGGTPTTSGGTPNGSGGAANGSGGGATAGTSAGGMSAGGAPGSAGSVGAAGAGGKSLGCGKTGKAGAFQATMTAFALERSYYLSVPTNYDPATPYALIFGYHGSNYTGLKMRSYLDLEKAPLAGKAIFVYPDGLPLSDQPDHVAWELNEGSRDLVFFDELLKKLTEEYCVDLSRVFANGQSFGGLMTNAVGCLRGDVLRAIAVVAGSGPRSTTCKGQVAAWLTHGTDDTSVSFASGEKSRDTWVKNNHCMATTVPGTPAQCQNYQGCDAGHPVIWCPHTADSGHQHPSFGKAAVRDFLATF